MQISYKGYEVESTTAQIKEPKKWTTSVRILQHTNNDLLIFPFSASNLFDTKEDADAHSINFGKRIIDGQHGGLSVPDK